MYTSLSEALKHCELHTLGEWNAYTKRYLTYNIVEGYRIKDYGLWELIFRACFGWYEESHLKPLCSHLIKESKDFEALPMEVKTTLNKRLKEIWSEHYSLGSYPLEVSKHLEDKTQNVFLTFLCSRSVKPSKLWTKLGTIDIGLERGTVFVDDIERKIYVIPLQFKEHGEYQENPYQADEIVEITDEKQEKEGFKKIYVKGKKKEDDSFIFLVKEDIDCSYLKQVIALRLGKQLNFLRLSTSSGHWLDIGPLSDNLSVCQEIQKDIFYWIRI